MDSIQVAYTLGGATLSLARADVENVSYVQMKMQQKQSLQ